ncbi:hypothetical protein AB0M43_32295 [Longispora sp. NPDC051575]|uniref:hypothetical protein n=1 Tax=Longispora sp. NPDC051575 TaxID=3154943 RepID=UPI00343C48D4
MGAASLAVVAFFVFLGHGLSGVWARYYHPPVARIALSQVPFLAAYALVPVWYWDRDFHIFYIGWLYALLLTLTVATLWVWSAGFAKRKVYVYGLVVGLVVVLNASGFLALRWSQTNAFGLRGERSPWAAFYGLAATSCVTESAFYIRAGKVIKAGCPEGSAADFYAGQYDKAGFEALLCSDQPRSAFSVWIDREREYRMYVALSFYGDWNVTVDGKRIGTPYPESIDGKTATAILPVEMTGSFSDESPKKFRVDRSSETWTVKFESTALGGWKVCRIDISNPIEVHPI